MFMFTTSVAYDVVRDYKDELLYVYHNKLVETLNALKYNEPIPTLLKMHSEFLKRGILGSIINQT